jgi:hypothetical protein
MRLCTRACMCVCICMYVFMSQTVYMCSHTRAGTHKYMPARTHAHTHAHADENIHGNSWIFCCERKYTRRGRFYERYTLLAPSTLSLLSMSFPLLPFSPTHAHAYVHSPTHTHYTHTHYTHTHTQGGHTTQIIGTFSSRPTKVLCTRPCANE